MKILLIQTAFIGDVILATALIESIKNTYPEAKLDFLLRKGNENLLHQHPYLHKVLIWNKNQKYKSLFTLFKQIRHERYDAVINLQRFGATGFLTAFSGAKIRSGFDKNPFSFGFTHTATHQISTQKNSPHEVARNAQTLSCLAIHQIEKPKLYPSTTDFEKITHLIATPFVCVAPTSVWFTKQYPVEKWIDLLNHFPKNYQIYLLGAPADKDACEIIRTTSTHPKIENLAGSLSLMQSAALMQSASLVLANDSAPLHLASAMNAPVLAIFCSTVPEFGFTPLSDKFEIIETSKQLSCRPCGLHGYKACPKGHFRCAYDIETKTILEKIDQLL